MGTSKTTTPSTVAGAIKSLTTTACNDLEDILHRSQQPIACNKVVGYSGPEQANFDWSGHFVL